MEWITGIQRAIDYLEEHLCDEISYAEAARCACCSEYNLMRVFSVLSGWTLGDYVRARRLTAAGQELISSDAKVLDLALKYGYDSPESFQRAFTHFHGVSPSQARRTHSALRSVSPLALKISIEGGTSMNYRIEELPEQRFLGYRRHFSGTPADRDRQTEEMFLHTRMQQYVLKGLTGDPHTQYTLLDHVTDDGFDFTIGAPLDAVLDAQGGPQGYELLMACNPDLAALFSVCTIPASTYAIFETERCRHPVLNEMPLRKQALSQWLPSSGYQLACGAERSVIHWFTDPERKSQRYLELWLPVEKA